MLCEMKFDTNSVPSSSPQTLHEHRLSSRLAWIVRYNLLPALRQKIIRLADQYRLSRLSPPNPETQRICVVRTDGIGDFILWLSAARCLRQLYPAPAYHLTLIANKTWAPLVPHVASFDDVWEMDLRAFDPPLRTAPNPAYRRQFLRRVREGRFGKVIHPTYSRDHNADIIALATAAPERIAFDGEDSNTPTRTLARTARWYTRLIPNPAPNTPELEVNARFVQALGATDFKSSIGRIDLPQGLLADELKLSCSAKPAFIVFPGAGMPAKQWPISRFAEVARQIHRRTGWNLWICGGPDDGPVANQLATMCTGVPTQNLAGKTRLVDLVLLISASHLVLTNDTAAAHIAAAVELRLLQSSGAAISGGSCPIHLQCPPWVCHFRSFMRCPASTAIGNASSPSAMDNAPPALQV